MDRDGVVPANAIRLCNRKSTIMLSESAIVILVPEAEALVESFRQQYDPSAARGMPSHVTMLYPFKPPSELTPDMIRKLGELFANCSCFTVVFPEARCLPGVLYLAPIPQTPFRRLIRLLARNFPETPPYRAQFTGVIPHLTVAQITDERRLREVTRAFQQSARKRLPIRTRVTEVTLMDNERGAWRIRHRFSLSPDGGRS